MGRQQDGCKNSCKKTFPGIAQGRFVPWCIIMVAEKPQASQCATRLMRAQGQQRGQQLGLLGRRRWTGRPGC